MFNGAHTVIYSQDAEADRAFFKSVLGMGHVDAGDGWLIFSLPPGEIAFHPHDTSDAHAFYFMCDDVEAVCAKLATHNTECAEPVDQGWGIVSSFWLPGGSRIGFYQPRHARPGSLE